MLSHGGTTSRLWFSDNALNVLNISMSTSILSEIVDGRGSSNISQSNPSGYNAVFVSHEWKFVSCSYVMCGPLVKKKIINTQIKNNKLTRFLEWQKINSFYFFLFFTFSIIHKPPKESKYSPESNVQSNRHIAKENPSRNENIIFSAWWLCHDVCIWSIEAQCCCRQAIGYEVHPQ